MCATGFCTSGFNVANFPTLHRAETAKTTEKSASVEVSRKIQPSLVVGDKNQSDGVDRKRDADFSSLH
jgi:hypothetical protein